MAEFQALLAVLIIAVLLAALARRVGAPYPAFLALGGAVLAFIPGAPTIAIPPDLALALFVAPVLLDAAFDTSLRDLRTYWVPIASLVIVSVGLTTIAVAGAVRWLEPGIPWPAAIALGAIVAPPDAAAATAVLRQLRPPHRVMTILEGESLLNDASALLIFRLALVAMASQDFSLQAAAPTFLLAVAGSIVAGPLLGQLVLFTNSRIEDAPTAIILQFVTTFGVWILAESIGLSPVLTMVCYAIAVARQAPAVTPARLRLPSYAVWETVVFILNVLAFVFIGLQIRPILSSIEPAIRTRYLITAVAVVVTVIVVRFVYVMSHLTVNKWLSARFPSPARHGELPPTFRGGVIVSWCGMRGIVSLAAALSLPLSINGSPFPFRDLIVLTAFVVVLGTLVLQGLTLRPLLNALALHDDDPVGREVAWARDRAIAAALETFAEDSSAAADLVRQELAAHLTSLDDDADGARPQLAAHEDLHREALAAARQLVLDLRSNEEIGDDAFHLLEEELDWLEMSSGRRMPHDELDS